MKLTETRRQRADSPIPLRGHAPTIVCPRRRYNGFRSQREHTYPASNIVHGISVGHIDHRSSTPYIFCFFFGRSIEPLRPHWPSANTTIFFTQGGPKHNPKMGLDEPQKPRANAPITLYNRSNISHTATVWRGRRRGVHRQRRHTYPAPIIENRMCMR